jgi:hypothetical protein
MNRLLLKLCTIFQTVALYIVLTNSWADSSCMIPPRSTYSVVSSRRCHRARMLLAGRRACV